MDAKRKSSLTRLSEEALQREGERARLLKMEEQLRMERNLLNLDKKKLENFAEEIRKRSHEVDETCKVRCCHCLWRDFCT